MMSRSVFVILFTLINALISECQHEAPRPLLPSEDDFYTPSDPNWADGYPGDILDHREVKLTALIPEVSTKAKAYQLLYVTKDVYGDPAYTVTTIVVPPRPDFDRLLSFQIAYDAPDINCSPSYGLQARAEGNALVWNLPQRLSVLPFLTHGPILNIPDYEGSNAAFTVGPQTARQTLDSIRAAINSTDITGVSKDTRTIMYGYSGGGFATEWASEFHSSYARDLQIDGAVIGGAPPNITKTFESIDGGMASAINVYALLGVSNAYENVSRYLDEHIKDEYREMFYNALRRCDPENCRPPPLKYVNVTNFFDNGKEFLTEFKDLLDDIGVMGRHGTPSFPIFMYKGLDDDITPTTEDSDKLVKDLRKNGANVLYYRYEGLNHADVLIAGMTPAWNWIRRVFNGKPPIKCWFCTWTWKLGQTGSGDPESNDPEGLLDGFREDL